MVIILKELADRIENHGKSCYPEECCGIILGKSGGGKRNVSDVCEFQNHQEENRRRRFFVTPREYMRAERIAAEKGLELLGFYHSHPDHPAIPSEFDREHALPWFTYIVLAVEGGEAKVMTAWELSDSRDKFLERHLSVEQNLRDLTGVGKKAGPV